MKKFLPILAFCCFVITTGFAQDGAQTQRAEGGRIDALKIAYITKKLDLNPEEAQRFWPIYNQYMVEIKSARQQYQGDKDELKLEETVLNVRKKYRPDFEKALTPEKINVFFRSEKEFGNLVQKEWQERRQMRMQQRHPLRQ